MRKHILTLFALCFSLLCLGNVRLPRIFNDQMVLQRDKPISVWGWADANEKVSVQFKEQSKQTKADKNGKWAVLLNAEPAGGPFTLTVKGKNTIVISNILVGEVWVCSGQSNMEFTVRSVNHADEEIKRANYPQIRHFLVQKSVSSKPEDDVMGGEWKICSPEDVGGFTAVGFFFARELYNSLKIPIGLIHTSWGGTHVETWTSREAFEGSDEFKTMIAAMPSVNLDELAKQRHDEEKAKLKRMNIILPATDVESWKKENFNDDKWNSMELPGLWEQKGLDGLDGVVWFRKSFDIDAQDAAGEGWLELAMIDDSDETFVNGISVGTTNQYNEKRKYKIPAGVLKTGRNVVSVRVDDTGGGGGIYGDAKEMKITTGRGSAIRLDGKWSYNVENISSNSTSVGPNSFPTLLYNAMINPILNVGIRGVIWYQGESNAGRAYQYRKAFPLLIEDWRRHWKQGDFPFYFVQLASFNADNGTTAHGSAWAELREAQSMTLSLPNTGMAVTIDVGESNDIHPRNKQDVGRRLAAIALNNLYGKVMVFSGPTYHSMKIEENRIRLTFTHIGSGILVQDKYGYLKGFEVAGADQKFNFAKAWVEGNEIVVSCETVEHPVAVRYAWADDPNDANLFNREGFPASPFRTDSWEGITRAAKYSIE